MEKEIRWTKLQHNRDTPSYSEPTAQVPSTSSISSSCQCKRAPSSLQPPPPSRCTGQLWLWALALTHQLAQGKQHAHKTQGCSYLLRLWQLVRDRDEQVNEYMHGGMKQIWERLGQRKWRASQVVRNEMEQKKCSKQIPVATLGSGTPHISAGVACLLLKLTCWVASSISGGFA